MGNEVVITFNTKRKILFFFIGSLFTFLSLLFLLKADSLVPFWVIRNPWILRLLGLIGTIVLGGMLLVYFRVLFRRIALIINDEGIIDSSSAGGEAGFIKWNDIKDIQRVETNGATVIKIMLVHPEELIKKKDSWLVRWSMKRNYKTYCTPVVIPMVLLNSYVDTLERILRDHLYAYRRYDKK